MVFHVLALQHLQCWLQISCLVSEMPQHHLTTSNLYTHMLTPVQLINYYLPIWQEQKSFDHNPVDCLHQNIRAT